MKRNAKLSVPANKSFVKELKDYNGTPYYSFLHNHSTRNKETDKWEIRERYVINVMNIIVKAGTEIQLTEILEAKPEIMYSKDGREFLNCVMWVNAREVVEDNNNNNYQPQQTYQQNYQQAPNPQYQQPQVSNQQVINVVDDDDLPF